MLSRIIYSRLIIFLFGMILCFSQGCGERRRNNEDRVIFYHSDRIMTGDLTELRKMHEIRVLAVYSKTNFFVSQGRPRGFEYELFREYEKFLNKDISDQHFHTRIVFVPIPYEELIPALLQGRGDIAAGLEITKQRRENVDFTQPYLTNVEAIIVTHKKDRHLGSLNDLSGRTVYVLNNSSYIEYLKELSARFETQDRLPIHIVTASKNFVAEDILELVNAGIIEVTVADRHIAQIWQSIFKKIKIRDDLKIHTGGQIAWAVRKESPLLLDNLNHFVQKNKRGTLVGNVLFTRYYQNTRWIGNPLIKEDRRKLNQYIKYFKKYADQYHFDWRAIAAQAYQESGLNQNAVSWKGAIGVMQVKPETAWDMEIENIYNAKDNIHAGVKYMHFLRKYYFNEPGITPEDKFNFTLAAYNAGPTRIQNVRELSRQMGLNPNKWFFHVERAALLEIGQETVRYVGNVNKYYVALQLIDKINRGKAAEMRVITGKKE